MKDYTPYQQKVIRRYYANQPQLLQQRLAELVGKLFLTEEAKREPLWLAADEIMGKLEVPRSRIDHLLKKRDPVLLAQLVKEIERK